MYQSVAFHSLFIFMLLHMYSLFVVVDDIYSEQNPLSVANILNKIDEKNKNINTDQRLKKFIYLYIHFYTTYINVIVKFIHFV